MRCSSSNIMEKFLKQLIIILVTIILSVGVCWEVFQSKPTSKSLQVSEDFDEDLEDARNFFNALSHEKNYMFYPVGDYRYFEILNWTKGPVFGYRYIAEENSLEFIVGNIDGSETTFFKIADIADFSEINKSSCYCDDEENIFLYPSETETSLQFTVGEKTYIIDRKLNVWDVPQTK